MLKGKVIAVTGGFGQLGVAVVRGTIAAGASVAALDRAPAPADAALLNGALTLGGLDLAEPDVAARALDQVAQQFGGLDGLINIAGTFRWEELAGGSIDTWDFLYRANLRSAVSTSRAALPHFFKRGGGRIVNIGAGAAAARAAAGMGAYTASKAGVAKLTEALAAEVKDRNITVNAILPSTIDTPANRADMPKADFSRWVAPQSIADAIVFLLSDGAKDITGALIPISGRV